MTNKKYVIFVSAILITTAAMAHDGVKNPVVKARMAAMGEIAKNMKTLGGMAQGKISFDAGAAQKALDEIAIGAGQMPSLFALPETDPKSEALPDIWTTWGDFETKSGDLKTTTEDAGVVSVEQLQQAMNQIGKTCKACHTLYRM